VVLHTQARDMGLTSLQLHAMQHADAKQPLCSDVKVQECGEKQYL
jgi:hypothetical protein